ncbi:unnamed protein product [Spodoptera littoralis]|uniref:Uncharacterized protein n=1 Tax=Spodoptera littoralis TaxID=7109 RepID=A0A9P0MYC6_SPOLI|nr:unnamed protein product [Spodoptera littoralis]CAH1637907.1 unnamed protein product [Spodoptera littoralis]
MTSISLYFSLLDRISNEEIRNRTKVAQLAQGSGPYNKNRQPMGQKGVKSTEHPKRHRDKTNEHDHGNRKPKNEMRHFQNENERHVKDEKLKDGRHIKDDNEKQGRHVKDKKSKDARHVKAEKLRERKHKDDYVKEGRHMKNEESKETLQEARHIKDENLKVPRHAKDETLKERRHTKDGNVKLGRHLKNEKWKEVKHIKDENLKDPRHAKYEKLRERRHKDDNIKEGRHMKNEDSKEIRHVKEGRHVKDDKFKGSTTSQNTTRKHPKDIRHLQNLKRSDVKNDKLKVSTLERTAKSHENVTTTSNGPGVPVTKLPDKILHKIKGRVAAKHLHGNHTSHHRKHKKSGSHKTKNDKPKPGFRARDSSYSYTSSSSTQERWPEEWDHHWMQKKLEALNSSQVRGDVINMAGARPWAFPCGDPGQHDLPWGTCMLAQECDAEYRIYRGDSFCGRTSLVCCALQLSNYDFYNGIDISFEGTSYSSNSQEDAIHIVGSKERKRRLEKKEKERRKHDRARRKRKMQKSIKSIVQEVKSILNKAFKNGTSEKQRKINRIREYINNMKKQYRKDRENLVKLHHDEMIVTDEKFLVKLNQVRGLNQAFMTNDTFRDIIVNGTINKDKLMVLLREQPQLTQYFKTRRSGGGEPYLGSDKEVTGEDKYKHEREVMDTKSKSQEYDVEYGLLYY